MPIPYDVADHIFRASKHLLAPVGWEDVMSKRGNERRRRLECRVRVDGGVPRGVFFRVTVFPRSLSRSTFQLECDLPTGRAHVPLYRLELEPLKPHINKLYGSDDVNGTVIPAGVTHEHTFHDSMICEGTLGPRPDEQARVLARPPQDFPTALAFVCSRINIANAADVPSPGDQGMLL